VQAQRRMFHDEEEEREVRPEEAPHARRAAEDGGGD